MSDYFAFIFSDEKTWFGIASFISGIISGSSVVTTGGAITALSLVGSKSIQAINNRNERIRQSDYGLVYTIEKKFK